MESDEVIADAGPRSEKRPLEESNEVPIGALGHKRAKNGGSLAENVKKVAEIVLVLATMGKMRGGRKPTAAEAELMAEAREKLAVVCEEFPPKDIFPRDAFGTVIEDLGLSRLREQRLGVRTPKLSIAESFKLAMEKPKDFNLHPAPNTSQLGGASENRGMPLAARTSASDRPSNPPLVHASSANSRSLTYQLPASEVKPVGSTVMLNSHLGKDSSSLALPRPDRAHLRLDGRPNGSYASHAQDHTAVKTPSWSVQPQSASSLHAGSVKVPPQTSVKSEGAADTRAHRMTTQPVVSKPLNAQAVPVNPQSMRRHLQGTFVQAPNINTTHSEVSKFVQKLLQPQLPEHPTWTPPSRDYMNKTLVCLMCKNTINEVDNVLVCDACDKGYHMKCLQMSQKAIPRGEWHCGKCLNLSNGKPLPPKYGRVLRNTNIQRPTSQPITVQTSLENKVQPSDENVNQQKNEANENSSLLSAHIGTVGASNFHHPTDSTKAISDRITTNNKSPSRTCSNNNESRTTEAASLSPHCFSSERSGEDKLVCDSKSPADSEAFTSLSSQSQDREHCQDNQTSAPNIKNNEVLSKHSIESERWQKAGIDEPSFCTSNGEIKKNEQVLERGNPVETIGKSNGVQGIDSSILVHDVEWVGDALRVVDGKTYYHSCRVNGVVYKLQDYALFNSSKGRQRAFKLQTMWEDSETGLKWVTANHCYFPSDLPKGVGRPCTPEGNEVYESNHNSSFMAGYIGGPCDVFPPNKYAERSEIPVNLGSRAGHEARPTFLCKWFFDESKSVFRDVSC